MNRLHNGRMAALILKWRKTASGAEAGREWRDEYDVAGCARFTHKAARQNVANRNGPHELIIQIPISQ